MAYTQLSLINTQAGVSSKASGLKFGPSLHLYPCFEHASSEGSAAKAQASLPSLLTDAMITEIPYTDTHI